MVAQVAPRARKSAAISMACRVRVDGLFMTGSPKKEVSACLDRGHRPGAELPAHRAQRHRISDLSGLTIFSEKRLSELNAFSHPGSLYRTAPLINMADINPKGVN
jgi:hypothetical protein